MSRLRRFLPFALLASVVLLASPGPAYAYCYQGQQCGLADLAGSILQGLSGSSSYLTGSATAQRLSGYNSIYNSFQPLIGQFQGPPPAYQQQQPFYQQQQPFYQQQQPFYQQPPYSGFQYAQPAAPVQSCRQGRWQLPNGQQIDGAACLGSDGQWRLQR